MNKHISLLGTVLVHTFIKIMPSFPFDSFFKQSLLIGMLIKAVGKSIHSIKIRSTGTHAFKVILTFLKKKKGGSQHLFNFSLESHINFYMREEGWIYTEYFLFNQSLNQTPDSPGNVKKKKKCPVSRRLCVFNG